MKDLKSSAKIGFSNGCLPLTRYFLVLPLLAPSEVEQVVESPGLTTLSGEGNFQFGCCSTCARFIFFRQVLQAGHSRDLIWHNSHCFLAFAVTQPPWVHTANWMKQRRLRLKHHQRVSNLARQWTGLSCPSAGRRLVLSEIGWRRFRYSTRAIYSSSTSRPPFERSC